MIPQETAASVPERPIDHFLEVTAAAVAPWVRERDVDLMLAQSLATAEGFAEWMADQTGSNPGSGALVSCAARVNYDRPRAAAGGSGETDVLAVATWADGVHALWSIENKVLASPQTDQALRHKEFLKGCEVEYVAAILVAPEQWIAGHAAEAAGYDARVTIESIAKWHLESKDPTIRWAGRLFEQAATQRAAFGPAADLDEWCTDLGRALGPAGLVLAEQSRQRATAPGQGKPGRFVWCHADTLLAPRGLVATLYVKTSSANHQGRVSIELPKADERLRWRLTEAARSAGFSAPTTGAGTLIVEAAPPAGHQFTTTSSIDAQRDAVVALAHAGVELRDWWNGIVSDS